MPVKRFTGVQPYDVASNSLVIPHLFPSNATDTAAYWKGYNWTNAIQAGMTAVGQTFSRQLGWANTEMFWLQNHMVAPKEKALKCASCHVPEGRLDFAALGYAPDRAAKLQTLVAFDIAMEATDTGPVLRWQGVPGYRYTVQSTIAPAEASAWAAESTGVFVPQATGELVWAEGAAQATDAKFYRVLRAVIP
jgi:hypothetical protein